MPIVKKMPPSLVLSALPVEENHGLAWTQHDPPIRFVEVHTLDPALHARCQDETAPKEATARLLFQLAQTHGFAHLAVLLPFQGQDRQLANLAFILRAHARGAGVGVTVLQSLDFSPPLAAGARIRNIRTLHRMKAQDFAEWIGRTRQMLARWETRADRVDRFTLWGIAGATGANYFYLLEGRGEPFGKDPRALRIASPTKV